MVFSTSDVLNHYLHILSIVLWFSPRQTCSTISYIYYLLLYGFLHVRRAQPLLTYTIYCFMVFSTSDVLNHYLHILSIVLWFSPRQTCSTISYIYYLLFYGFLHVRRAQPLVTYTIYCFMVFSTSDVLNHYLHILSIVLWFSPRQTCSTISYIYYLLFYGFLHVRRAQPLVTYTIYCFMVFSTSDMLNH